MITPNDTISRGPGQSSVNLDGEVVILDLERGAYFGLDEVGARFWELIETPKRFEELCDILLDEYEVERATLERDLQALVQDLSKRGLVGVES
jgi:hypothetical protein